VHGSRFISAIAIGIGIGIAIGIGIERAVIRDGKTPNAKIGRGFPLTPQHLNTSII
jgi:hypothetical protein